MTAEVLTGAAGFLARYDRLREQLPGDPAPRDAAAVAFRRMGVPGGTAGRREEAWKYTNLRPLAEIPFQTSITSATDASLHLSRLRGWAAKQTNAVGEANRVRARLVIIDGRFHPELSAQPEPTTIRTFADHPEFGPLARPDRDPLVALNTMLAEDGVAIDVPDNTDGGLIQLISITTDTSTGPIAFHPRHIIRLGLGARLTLIETATGHGAYLHNPVTEIHVAEAATLSHIRLQDEAPAAFHLSTVYAEIAAGATYDSFALNLGAQVTRTEIHARLAGPNAAVHLNGAQLLRGTQHADFTSVVRHDAPSCASRQTVKNVLAGRSRGVFQGRIEVARAAQKTDGYQMSQALLLSPDAEIDTKPELEIFADDVKCSHGATVGALDPDQLFYLRARGVPEQQARSILVRAFLAEAVDVVRDDDARAALEHAVERWWETEAA